MEQSQASVGRICPRGASYYTWQRGDTAQSVASANSTTVQAMQVLNPDVNFTTIPAGTEICLPSQVYTCISGQPYTVSSGDTFTSIAAALGITTFELLERNPGVSPDSLVAGQVLCVPDTTTDPGQVPVIPLPNPGEGPAIPDRPSTPTIPSIPSIPSVPIVPIIPIVPSNPCPTGYTYSSVQSGESYADLLIRHNVSYRAMRAANPGLTPGGLIAGTRYCAPPWGMRQTCSGLTTYTIQPGETLNSIAQNLRTTRGRLLALNPCLLPSDFSSGTVICIP